MSTVLPNLGAKPTDLKIENVYKITKLNGKSESRELTRYKELNLIYADGPKNLTDNDSLFTFKIDGEPMWVKHVGEKEHNTYRVDDHRQMQKFPNKGDVITIEHDPDASGELDAINRIKREGTRNERKKLKGKGKTRKRKRRRKSTKKKRRRKRKRTKKKRRRRRR